MIPAADSPPPVFAQYLLGALSDAEAAALDERLFVESGTADAVALAEHHLIMDYLEGRLSARDLARFTQHYLASPVHRERLAITHVLRQRAGAVDRSTPTAQTHRPGWWAVAAALLMAAALGWLATQLDRRAATQPAISVAAPVTSPLAPTSVAPSGTASSGTTPSTPPSSIPARSAASLQTAPTTVALTLSAIVTRGDGDAPALTLPVGASRVELRIADDVPATGRLSAELALVDAPEQSTRWPVERTRADAAGARARVIVPARSLAPGDYVLTLWASGVRVVRRYSFRVDAS